ncbi:MAG: ABC transporter ATP-binding protein [Candidatus Caldarchaeum sp.]|nr:ABC transporter ATP-binding protein [Candidatus Caldarchaeum sp.]MCX8201809.1 ABC transporter ATP-binding protein [Candidatus Caldarchaeum sp.]MDW8063657.1 ABC transporter ATP-binding protein [Candidatus Caldarchaeum sp.]MDW8435936.1 ABC transporter ATP-binding protein [Candidatus Caldarchaeum sp.]
MVVLSVENLKVRYRVGHGAFIHAVEDVSFKVDEGETVAIVGESGSGKSTTALAIPRLLPPSATIAGGRIIFKGKDIMALSKSALNKIRGKEIGFVFQEPVSYLNPLIKVGEQIAEVLILHDGLDKKDAKLRALKLLEQVKVSDPHRVFNNYPHQLSGGMAQRVNIAIAIALNPSLLIADEPTSNLDVTVQAQILNLILSLKKELGMAVILVTHDLGVVSGVADRVLVMYAGKLVEEAPVKNIFDSPLHPYTKLLLKAVGRQTEVDRDEIRGSMPNLVTPPPGCRFLSRCPMRMDHCSEEVPEISLERGVRVLCWLYGDRRGS